MGISREVNVETKKCSKCGEDKPLAQYHKSKITRSGLMYICKSCLKESTRASRLRNPETVKKQALARYWKDPAGERQKVAAWRKANPDKVAEYARRYVDENRGKVRVVWRRAIVMYYLRKKFSSVPESMVQIRIMINNIKRFNKEKNNGQSV